MAFSHVPVLLDEVMTLLEPQRGGVFVDGTLGGGGHSAAILDRLPASGRLIGIDRDGDAIEAAVGRLGADPRFTAVRGNFFNMKDILSAMGVERVNGILLDLGVSSYQLDTAERGFSYHGNAPLDMRMDTSAALSAADVVNGYSFEELARILREYGEERFSARIADRIVKERLISPIQTTSRLAEICRQAIPGKFRNEPQHPARRTFQAIRIEVNGELEGLKQAVTDAHDLLQSGGKLCIITFHSLEDRIVKQTFRLFEHPCTCPPSAPVCICGKTPTAVVLTRKPMVSGEEELGRNPRASSAKLRAIQRM